VIGLIIALAIMWAVLGFALISGDGGSDAPNVIYDQSKNQEKPEKDD